MIVRWYVTLACVVVCLAGVVYFARSKPPVYLTTMKVIPASAISGAGGGGGTSILGISIGGSGVSGKMALYLALLQSPTVARVLIDKYHYDKILYEGAIDTKTGKWKPTYERNRDAFLDHLFGIQAPDRPSVRDISGAINSMITLSTDTDKATGADTGAILVTCRSSERIRCSQLQALLNKMSLEQTKKISEYLTREMPNVSEVEARTAMATLLANTQRDIALSSLAEHSVATILEGPSAAELPTFPNPQTMLFMGFVLGLVLGGAITWFTWGLRLGDISELLSASRHHHFRRTET
jgi:hypothetical protein